MTTFELLLCIHKSSKVYTRWVWGAVSRSSPTYLILFFFHLWYFPNPPHRKPQFHVADLQCGLSVGYDQDLAFSSSRADLTTPFFFRLFIQCTGRSYPVLRIKWVHVYGSTGYGDSFAPSSESPAPLSPSSRSSSCGVSHHKISSFCGSEGMPDPPFWTYQFAFQTSATSWLFRHQCISRYISNKLRHFEVIGSGCVSVSTFQLILSLLQMIQTHQNL